MMFAMHPDTVIVAVSLLIIFVVSIRVYDIKRRKALLHCRRMLRILGLSGGANDASVIAHRLEKLLLFYEIMPTKIGLSDLMDLHWRALVSHHLYLRRKMIAHYVILRESALEAKVKSASKVTIRKLKNDYGQHREFFERRFNKTLRIMNHSPALVDLR